MALTKAQIAKLEKDLAKAEADLAKAKAAAAKKPAPVRTPNTPSRLAAAESGAIGAASIEAHTARDAVTVNPISGAQTSGPVVGFTPPFRMPEPKVEPGNPRFTGPVAPVAPVAPVVPPAEERTMAVDTFRRTLALFFGEAEMGESWVNALYGVTSKYYKTGSTIDESLNLALRDVRTNPELATFTKRFKGLYDLQDRFAKGEVVEVPTIAGFFKAQEALGVQLVNAGLPDLANREFLGEILGTGKSVLETTTLINEVFAAIDNAPAALKKDLETVAPGADRTAIARAILMGKQGAAAINKQIAATSVFSAAKTQGVNIDMATATDYAARGFDYGSTLTTAGNVALGTAPLEKLTEISTGKAVKPEEAQATMRQAMFENSVAAQEQIRLEAEREGARFGGRSGTLGSRSLASRNRANRAI